MASPFALVSISKGTNTNTKRLIITLGGLFLLSFLISPVIIADTELKEFYNTGDDATVQVYSNNWSAQTFTTTSAHNVSRVRLLLSRTGTPGTITLELRNAGRTVTYSTAALNADAMTNPNATWYPFQFPSSVSLEDSTTYSLVVYATTGNDTTHSVNWAIDSSVATYTGGSEFTTTNAGITWTGDTDDDYMFEVYGETDLEIKSAKIFQDYYATGDWLLTTHYVNTAEPHFPAEDIKNYWYLRLLQGTNLLSNGNFENGDPPVSWTADTSTLSQVVNPVRVGLYSMSIDSDGANSSATQDLSTPNVHSNLTLTLGAWVYAPSTNDTEQRLAINFNTGTDVIGSAIPQDDAWHWTTVTGTAGTSETLIQAKLYSSYNGGADTDDILYVDNAILIMEASLFEDSVIAQSPLRFWGSRPASIYLSASDVSDLDWGNTFVISLFSNYGGALSATYAMQPIDWSDATSDALDSWIISTGKEMETYYSSIGADYVTAVAQRGEVLTEDGGALFTQTIPGLYTTKPDIFEVTSNIPDVTDSTAWTQAFKDESFAVRVGSTVDTNFGSVASLLNLSTAEFAGIVVMLILICLLFLVAGQGILAIMIAMIPIALAGTYIQAIDIVAIGVAFAVLALLFVWSFWFSKT